MGKIDCNEPECPDCAELYHLGLPYPNPDKISSKICTSSCCDSGENCPPSAISVDKKKIKIKKIAQVKKTQVAPKNNSDTITLLSITKIENDFDSGSSEYPYLREMKERLLISKDTPITMLDACRQEQDTNQLLEVHQSPVGTVVKLNPDGYGSHTTPTHRVESLYTGTLESRRTHAHEFFPKNAKLHDVKLVLSFFLLGALSTSKALLLFPKRLKIWSSKSSPSYSEEISDFLLKIIYYIM